MAGRARGARRGGLRPRPGDARGRARPASGSRRARAAAGDPDHRLHGLDASSATGSRHNARQALVYTEKAGVNSVVIDSTDDYQGMLRNLAFSLSLYSGQMCTTTAEPPRPARRDRAPTRGTKSFDEVAQDLAGADRRAPRRPRARCGDPRRDRPAPTCWSGSTGARTMAGSIRASQPLEHPEFADATVRTPLLVAVDAAGRERRLPRGVASARSRSSSRRTTPPTASSCCGEPSGITARSPRASTRPTRRCLRPPRSVALETGVAALGEPHRRRVRQPVRGVLRLPRQRGPTRPRTPTFTDAAFVASRFRVVQSRWPIPDETE